MLHRSSVLAALAAALVAAALLAGCGPRHAPRDERLEQDLAFGFDKLLGEMLVVAGLPSGYVGLTAQERVWTGAPGAQLLPETIRLRLQRTCITAVPAP